MSGGGQASRTLEERRRSMLDHHWPVPSKDQYPWPVEDEQQDSLNSDKVSCSLLVEYNIKFLIEVQTLIKINIYRRTLRNRR